MKVIEVVISVKGVPTVQTKGFAGDECRRASEFIEKALGQRSNERLTAEFHRETGQQQVTRQSN
jgi:hypothetical protein